MLHQLDGDVFEKGYDFIIHQANCQATMGAGIAATIKKEFPSVFEADKKFKIPPGRGRLGSFSFSEVPKRHAPKENFTLFNLYGQDNWCGASVLTEYDAFEKALNGILTYIQRTYPTYKDMTIAVPYLIGCDRAGGEWSIVSTLLEKASLAFDIDIYISKYTP